MGPLSYGDGCPLGCGHGCRTNGYGTPYYTLVPAEASAGDR